MTASKPPRLRKFTIAKVFYERQVRAFKNRVENHLLNNPGTRVILEADTWGGMMTPLVEATNGFMAICGDNITTYVSTECWSSGLLLSACGKHRAALRGCRFMIHEPLMPLDKWKSAAQKAYTYTTMRRILDDAEQHAFRYFGFLDQRTEQPSGFWRGKATPSPDNHYYTAEQMREWGLVTHIVDHIDEVRALALAD